MSASDLILGDDLEPRLAEWETHGSCSLLIRPPVVAVIFHEPTPHGIVRLGPREAASLGQGSVADLQDRVEGLLRQGRTAWDQLLEGEAIDEPSPEPEATAVVSPGKAPRTFGQSLEVLTMRRR